MQEAKPRRRQDLEERLIEFAARALDVAAALPKSPVGRHLAEQLTRCGTSPMANYAEAQGAESRKDFVHKLKVALKELRETHAWLRLIQRRELAGPRQRLLPIVAECDELIAMFVASVKTAQAGDRPPRGQEMP